MDADLWRHVNILRRQGVLGDGAYLVILVPVENDVQVDGARPKADPPKIAPQMRLPHNRMASGLHSNFHFSTTCAYFPVL